MTGSGQVQSNIGMEGDAHYATLHARSTFRALLLLTFQKVVAKGLMYPPFGAAVVSIINNFLFSSRANNKV
jgi:hypothetical protein